MQFRVAVTILLAAALAGCGGQRAPATDHHLPPSIATPPNDAALLRVAHAGGTAELLRVNTLVARPGSTVSGLPPISRILGASSVDDQTVYAADNAGRLVAIDLKNQRSRLVPTSARQFTATPDGTILGVDSAHHPVRLINRNVVAFKAPVDKGTVLMRGPGDQILTIGNRPGSLQVLGQNGEVRHLPMPNGRATATWIGDLVAVATDSGIAFVDPSGKPASRKALPRFVKVRGNPTVAAFSPSGHRLYVGRKTGGLAMLDRYNRQLLKELPLAGTPDGLRVDRSGRWLLVHGNKGDSLWAVDVTRWAVAWSGAAPWGEDLPQVIDGETLLLRRRSDVIAVDLSGTTPTGATLAGGAGDLYMMLPWVSRSAPTTDVATAAPEPQGTATQAPPATGAPASAPPAQTPATTTPPPPPPTATLPAASPTGTIYLQLSASQNPVYSETLAKQLRDGGYPAKVLDPKTSDETYRVVVGPYASRADADSVGKRIGRPYFIVTPGSGDT